MTVNKLYYGDCLSIMQDMPLASVDLIYLDPPFNSNRQYNAIYQDETGRPLPDQIEAFCDMRELDPERERAIRTMPVLMRESGIDDATVELWRLWMQALRGTQPRLLAYLSYMAQRLLVMHRILKPTGSLYLHCDPTASHYVKALMDAIFGHDNFRNEIIWRRARAKGNISIRLPRNHDVILAYAASQYASMQSFIPYDLDDLPDKTKEQYRSIDADGRHYQLTSLTNPNRNRPNLTYEFLGVTRVWRWTKDRLQAEYDAGRVVQTRPGAVPRFKPGFPILVVFRLKGQSKRDGSIIVRSCKASQSPVYPIRDAILAVNHVSCPSLSSSGPRQWGETALKTRRLPGALSLLARSWLHSPSAWRRR